MLRSLFPLIWLASALLSATTFAGTPQPTLPKVTLTVGSQHLSAEIARTPDELSQGLMFRTKMGDNEGMLFCLTQEGPASFWMENTLLPLSVAYLDRNGKILEIHDMQPLDTTTIRSDSDKVYYAVEVNQGWFTLNKIPPGEIFKTESTTLEKIRNQTTRTTSP